MKDKIQEHINQMSQQLSTLKGNKTTLEEQLEQTIIRINAIEGALEVSRLYLQEVEPANEQPQAINEEALEEQQ